MALGIAHDLSEVAGVQVWKDALAQKQESPYMRHTLASGVLRNFHFCPYEVPCPPPPPAQYIYTFIYRIYLPPLPLV